MAKSKLDSWINGETKEITDASDQPEEQKRLCAWLNSELEERRASPGRLANEEIWLTNTAYLMGLDSVRFDSKSRQFRAVNLLPGSLNKSRIHVNKILPTCQNRQAKLCKSVPKWEVRPKSSDDEDKEAARLGKAIILQDWDVCQVNKKRLDLVMWLQQCGHAYLKVNWDANAGPKELSRDEKGQVEAVHLGDKRVDVVSPFEIFPDTLAKTWEELNDLVHAKVRPLTYFRNHYPDKGHLVKEEETWVTSLQYEMRINSFNSVSGGSAGANPAKNTAIEISYYEKPSRKHPGGRHIICANGVLLKDDVLPIDEIPFAKFDDIKVAGKYNSEAIITHIRPMQDQYNRNKTLRAAWINRLVAGKYIAARGHNLGAESMNDQSGEVVEYDHLPSAPEPHPMQIPVIPQYVYQEDEGLLGDINDVSGVNQSSRGQMESASMPALGMQILIEQDDTRIGVETESHEYSYADLGRILLKFTAKYYTSERLLKEVGQGFNYIVRKFKGADLRDNFDVHVRRGSTAPGSKVLERENIRNFHQQGYFGNPQDPKVMMEVLSMLEFGDEFEPWKRISLIKHSIQKGIEGIENEGIKPVVSEFDNHPMWIQELDDYRLSDRFEKIDEAKQALVIQTMEEHLMWTQRMVAPETMEDPDEMPELKPTTAAQENEEQIMSDMPEDAVEQSAQMQMETEMPQEGM